MGLYSRFILPHLIDLSMKNRVIAQRRAEITTQAAGRVLDVGIGSGLNLPFYGASVTHVWGIDPSPELLEMARRKVSGLRYSVDLVCESAEKIPLDDRIVDTVVLTWALCTIPNPSLALAEMRRVLKPEGMVIFAEHGLSPDRKVQIWQARLNPVWKRIAGGCNMNRKIDHLLTEAGFKIVDLRTSYSPGPRFLTYTYQGRACIAA
jgi:ubiquinone/menaquinone biosynthesis C-methylase UbiE